MGIIRNFKVTGYTGHPGNGTALANSSASGHGGTARDRTVPPNHHIVGNLNLVIQLYARLDARVIERTAIDGNTGTDFDPITDHHATELAYFLPALIAACKTEAVARSEEHTSELQSRPHLVCRLL